jgi:Zn-dependent protease
MPFRSDYMWMIGLGLNLLTIPHVFSQAMIGPNDIYCHILGLAFCKGHCVKFLINTSSSHNIFLVVNKF